MAAIRIDEKQKFHSSAICGPIVMILVSKYMFSVMPSPFLISLKHFKIRKKVFLANFRCHISKLATICIDQKRKFHSSATYRPIVMILVSNYMFSEIPSPFLISQNHFKIIKKNFSKL